MLQISNLSKSLGKFTLKDISLELPDGYIMGLIGPNGSGKTTLLHLILGLYHPNTGTVLIDGLDYENHEQAIKERLGCVLQESLFNDSMSLLENAEHYGKYYKQYDREILREYLERFKLEPSKLHNKLSKGEELKFQFAFALSHQPKLLILDEPTANFDPEFREEFLSILKDYIADGTKSIILATHLTEDLDQFADYIAYLNHGNLVMYADIETMRDSYRLVSGEAYKIKLIAKDKIIHMEEGSYTSKALVKHKKRTQYDASLDISIPSLAEIMYFTSK